MNTDKTIKIFISYSNEDLSNAIRLYKCLKNLGVTPWIDKFDLLPGQKWKIKIRQSIKESRYVIILLSSNSVSKKGFVNHEIKYSLDLLDEFPESEIYIIPVRLDKCVPSHEKLRELHFVDLFPEWENGLNSILRAIEAEYAFKDLILSNPYKGLSSFDTKDADFFYGRENLIQNISCKFKDIIAKYSSSILYRLFCIIGPSGSGKSSILKAGLIPYLCNFELKDLKDLTTVSITPGVHPIESLSRTLARLITEDQVPIEKSYEFEKSIKKGSDGLRKIGDALFDIKAKNLLLIIDQFEETFTLCKDVDERKCFIENILEATSDDSFKMSCIIVMRSDFLGDTLNYIKLNRIISNQSIIVPMMDDNELRLAISEPAKKMGRPLEDSVINLMIEQVKDREGCLPLLQFSLTRIWDGLNKNIPSIDTLNSFGGVGGVVANVAQQLFDSLNENEAKIAKRTFIKLVQLGEGTKDTRRKINIDELIAHCETGSDVYDVVRKFSYPDARLITLSYADGDTTVEITHEALLDHWLVLQNWLSENRESLRIERRLDNVVKRWNLLDKPKGMLWQSPDLELLEQFCKDNSQDMTSLQIEFYNSSKRKHFINKLTKRSIIILLIIFSFTITILAYLSNQRRIEAEKSKLELEKQVAITKLSISNIAAQMWCLSSKNENIYLFPILGKQYLEIHHDRQKSFDEYINILFKFNRLRHETFFFIKEGKLFPKTEIILQKNSIARYTDFDTFLPDIMEIESKELINAMETIYPILFYDDILFLEKLLGFLSSNNLPSFLSHLSKNNDDYLKYADLCQTINLFEHNFSINAVNKRWESAKKRGLYENQIEFVLDIIDRYKPTVKTYIEEGQRKPTRDEKRLALSRISKLLQLVILTESSNKIFQRLDFFLNVLREEKMYKEADRLISLYTSNHSHNRIEMLIQKANLLILQNTEESKISAKDIYQELLGNYPELRGTILFNQAYNAFEIGDFDTALKNYNECISINYSKAVCLNNISYIFEKRKEYDKAVQYSLQSFKEDMDYVRLYKYIGILEHYTDMKKTSDTLAEFYIQYPDNVPVKLIYSRLLLSAGEEDKALEILNKLVGDLASIDKQTALRTLELYSLTKQEKTIRELSDHEKIRHEVNWSKFISAFALNFKAQGELKELLLREPENAYYYLLEYMFINDESFVEWAKSVRRNIDFDSETMDIGKRFLLYYLTSPLNDKITSVDNMDLYKFAMQAEDKKGVLCELNFYTGIRFLKVGNVDKGKMFLQKALETKKIFFFEFQLASIIMNDLDKYKKYLQKLNPMTIELKLPRKRNTIELNENITRLYVWRKLRERVIYDMDFNIISPEKADELLGYVKLNIVKFNEGDNDGMRLFILNLVEKYPYFKFIEEEVYQRIGSPKDVLYKVVQDVLYTGNFQYANSLLDNAADLKKLKEGLKFGDKIRSMR